MKNNLMSTNLSDGHLYTKEALVLPPRKRLELLLSTENYFVSKKRTSIKKQIEEFIDLYELCCFLLLLYFPDKQAELNYLLLNFSIETKKKDAMLNDKVIEKLKLLSSYEALERKINAIQFLFYQCKTVYPDVYEYYNLDERLNEKITDIVENLREIISEDKTYLDTLAKRWDLF